MPQKPQQAQLDPYPGLVELRHEYVPYKWSSQLHAKIGIALFLSLMLLILFAPLKTSFYYYDEGFAVFNATRVINQEIPYKDFWAIYPPGQLYTLAAIFKLFGSALIVSRIYDTFVRFAIVIGVYFTARKITSQPLAVVAGLTTTLLMTSVGFYAYAVYPALALSIWGIWSSLEYTALPATAPGRLRWLLVAGILTGISSLYRWDIGLYASLSLAASVFLYHLFDKAQATETPPPAFKTFLTACKMGLLVLAGSFTVLLIGYGLVSLKSGLNNVWEQVFLFPATKLHDVRWRAYPSLIPSKLPKLSDFWSYYSEPMDWVRFYLPLAVYAIALVYYAYALLVKRITINSQHFGTIAAALCGPLLFAQALSRYDYIHVLPSTILASLVIVSLFSQTNVLGGLINLVPKVFLYALLPVMVAVYFTAPLDPISSALDNMPPWGCYSHLKRASCAYTGENQQRAVDFVRSYTSNNDPIFVGNQRHDYVFVNDVGFYFLADRPSATRYSELHPGVATTLPVQKEIAGELESKNVNVLVLVDIPNSGEPNASVISSGVHYLDEYIRSKYTLVAQYGEYQIWERSP